MRPLPPFATPFLVASLFLILLAAHPALASGPVVGWGSDDSGQATPPPSVDGTTGAATAIAAGGGKSCGGFGGCDDWGHSCAIQAATGAVVCWGSDYYGQASPPPSVDGTTGIATAIAAAGWSCSGDICGYGMGHSCAIQAGTGAVVCWGGTAAPPPSVDGTTGTATAIAAGGLQSCAIQAGTGAVVCWGVSESSPPSVDGTTGAATAIAAGDWHSCAIQAGSGAVVCWGWDDDGQATPPPSVDGTTGTATAIAAGGSHSCAIQADTGAVVCWGDDSWGQATPLPSVDGTAGTATAIAAGGTHSCAIQEGTGAVVCWGADWWGADWYGQSTPPPSVDGTAGTATAIAAGRFHAVAIRTPACSDGLDNNGDGLTDYPDDPLCSDGDDLAEWPICSDGLDNDSDGSTDYPADAGCGDLLDSSEEPDLMQAKVKLKIRLKFNKPSKDKILVLIKDWQLPAGVVPTDVTVNVGGAECTGTLDAKGKFKSLDGRDAITMKQSKKTQLWSIAVKRKKSDFAADLWDEGCTDADNPTPGLPVTVPLIINVDGVAYGRDVDLVYRSERGTKGNAK